jgi:hypothetical protein
MLLVGMRLRGWSKAPTVTWELVAGNLADAGTPCAKHHGCGGGHGSDDALMFMDISRNRATAKPRYPRRSRIWRPSSEDILHLRVGARKRSGKPGNGA